MTRLMNLCAWVDSINIELGSDDLLFLKGFMLGEMEDFFY